MGHTDQTGRAKQLIAAMLHFDLVQTDGNFELTVKRAGMERFEHVIRLVELWARPTTTHREKYDRLMWLLRMVTPPKAEGTKYRNPMAGAAVRAQQGLDAEMMDRIAREP